MSTPLIINLSVPHPYFSPSHQSEIQRENRNAFLYSSASKICLIAFSAIAAATLSISIGLTAPISSPLLACLMLISIPLQSGFQYFGVCSRDCFARAEIARLKKEKFEVISDWNSEQIKDFFNKHQLNIEDLPMDSLSKISPEDPLKALLPAIASFLYYIDQKTYHLDRHEKNLTNLHTDSAIKLYTRQQAWHILENDVLPSGIQAAITLQAIAHPRSNPTLDKIGRITAKTFEQRRFDQLLEGNDDYLYFSDEKRPPLNFTTLQDLILKNDYNAIRLLIFPEEKIK